MFEDQRLWINICPLEMFPVCAPAHPDQANQISGHHTITKEWSDVWGNQAVLRQDNLRYYFLESEQKHRRGR